MNWYAVYAKSEMLDEAVAVLKHHNIHTVVAKCEKWFSNSHIREYVTSLLVPNCAFIETNLDMKELLAICNDSEVFDSCTLLSDSEALIIQTMFHDSNVIGRSIGAIENSVLKVSEGPLMGMESKITKIDRHKRVAYIDMKLLGRDMRLPLEVVSKS
ncbi:MAG: hypothetical protein IKM20_08720 [Erysipelotrichales bacterium]|nr:hypothetical protein [Erysipelotrichales bacterium]